MPYLARKEVGGGLKVHFVRPSSPPAAPAAYGDTFPARLDFNRRLAAAPSRRSLFAGGWYGVGPTMTEAIEQLVAARDANPQP